MKTEFIAGLNPNGFHKIAVHVWPNAMPDAVPVICVHGLTRNGRDFDALAQKVSATRPVYCPDMAGRGCSDDLPDFMHYTMLQYMADLTSLIARTGAAQVDWVGTSMGGILGMLLAAQPQSPIRRLVLNDVGPVIAQESLMRIGSYLAMGSPVCESLAQIEAHMRKIYASFGTLSDEMWRHMAETGTRKTAEGKLVMAYDPRLAQSFQSNNAEVNLWGLYDKITNPTLVLRGALSDLLTKETAREMTERGPCARLVEIEGVGHTPSLMSADQIQLVEDFLKG